MELPDPYIVSLYMISLGEEYRTLDTVVQVLPADQRTLSDVMKLAESHGVEQTDEADNSGIALMAQNKKKRKREQALEATCTPSRGGCTVFGDPFHVAAESFKPGSKLSKLVIHHSTVGQLRRLH